MVVEPLEELDALDQARLECLRNPTSSYAASQFLHLLRVSKGDPAQTYKEAKQIWDRLPEDQWVNKRFFWICYDLVKL